ncbi:MAG: flavin reductase family protein [Gemmatimonadales bacterium]
MAAFDFSTLDIPGRSRLITRIVAPRPIAFVSSRSAHGTGNLAPFSFFTAGGSNPPSVVFCTTNDRSGRGKDTLRNIEETHEYVINLVAFRMAARMNQASYAYPSDVDEFDAAGFTRVPSVKVAPPGVAESPARLECRLHEVVRHGSGASASNYIIGEMLYLTVDDDACTDGLPDNAKLDQVARLGGDLYTRVKPEALFAMPRPLTP